MTPTKKKLVVVLQDATNSKTTIWIVNQVTFYTGYIRYCDRGTYIYNALCRL